MTISQFITQPFMNSALEEACSDARFVQYMLDFELAIIDAREHHKLIPVGTHQHIKNTLTISKFDIEELAATTYLGGNPAIPFVAQAKALLDDKTRPYFHKDVTSQDVVDTALMLVISPILSNINRTLIEILKACRHLIDTYCTTPMVGRTLLQHALPITFGVKVSQWAASLLSVAPSLNNLQRAGLFLQWGGPVGVSSEEIERHQLPQFVAKKIGLAVPLLPWHTNRQPIHHIGCTVDALAGAYENIAVDVSLLCQFEVGELSEPAIEGMGGSSSMPHKQNPVLSALVKTAALRVHGHLSVISNTTAQPFERGLGEWHASWQPLIESLALMSGASDYMNMLLQGVRVYPKRMAENLDVSSEAYLRKPLSELFADNAPVQAVIKEASEHTHKHRVGFVRAFCEIVDTHELAHDLNQHDLSEVLSPLSYCGAAYAQCDTVKDAIDDALNSMQLSSIE